MNTPKKPSTQLTLQTLADKLELSRSTVSEILNGSERYSKKTIKKVWDLANKLNFQPNRFAQAIRRGSSSKLIGVLHSSGPLQVVNERALFLGREIAKTGYELLLLDNLWQSASSSATLINQMLASRIQGFIFSGNPAFAAPEVRRIFEQLNKSQIPSILISAPSVLNTPAINADFEQGFYDLTRHLLQTGRRRLTFLTAGDPEQDWHVILRYKGFSRAIRDAGGIFQPYRPVSEYKNKWSGNSIQGEAYFFKRYPEKHVPFNPYKSGLEVFSHLLDVGFTADAVVTSNDENAAAVISVCIRRGIAVPEQIAVTGFDNSSLAELSPVPITSASQESQKTCEYAVELLLRRMQGKPTPSGEILINCPIILRKSSLPNESL